jgi:hypothetical protein
MLVPNGFIGLLLEKNPKGKDPDNQMRFFRPGSPFSSLAISKKAVMVCSVRWLW